jgi:hypothetical protein
VERERSFSVPAALARPGSFPSLLRPHCSRSATFLLLGERCGDYNHLIHGPGSAGAALCLFAGRAGVKVPTLRPIASAAWMMGMRGCPGSIEVASRRSSDCTARPEHVLPSLGPVGAEPRSPQSPPRVLWGLLLSARRGVARKRPTPRPAARRVDQSRRRLHRRATLEVVRLL